MYRVFLADDEVWALAALKNLIDWSQYGFAVIGEAENGQQALERIEKDRPDLILSDIRMPGMDGLTLIQTIREKNWKSEVLLVSGYTDFEYAKEAIRLGCRGYLVKPVAEEELVEYLGKMKEILDEAEKRQKEEEVREESGFQSERVLVRNMIRYLREHYAESLTLQVLARKFGISESYVSSLIRKDTGKRFSDHLTEIRIHRAQELLRATNDSIEKIAEQVGYPDYYYFTKVYKKITGISPAVYRKQL